jgi:iron complex outermembrane receptor protein
VQRSASTCSGRSIDDYITVVPDPDVPKRLPLSPNVVYRYINGEAQFYGYEAYGNSPIGSNFELRGSLSYVWARDETFDEPAFGIPPLKFIVAGKVKSEDGRYWAELELTTNSAQERVAAARFESPTPAWERLDLRSGFALVGNLGVRVGLLNLTNEQYATHLNAANPFTRARIAEPGRSFYVGV